MKVLFFAAALQLFAASVLAAEKCSVVVQTAKGAQTIEGNSGECLAFNVGPRPMGIKAKGLGQVKVSTYKNRNCSGPPFYYRPTPIDDSGVNAFVGFKLEC